MGSQGCGHHRTLISDLLQIPVETMVNILDVHLVDGRPIRVADPPLSESGSSSGLAACQTWAPSSATYTTYLRGSNLANVDHLSPDEMYARRQLYATFIRARRSGLKAQF